MKKILTILITGFLVLGGLGVAAIHNGAYSQTEQVTIKNTWIKSEPLTIIQEESYVKVTYEKESSLLMVPGKPLLPRIVKSFELPFGATNIDVQVALSATYEQTIDKQIQPSPSLIPLSPIENYKAPSKKDTQLYQSTDPYPFEWYQFDVGVDVSFNFQRLV